MPRISGIEMLKRTEQPVIVVRKLTRVEELPQLIGESYGKMAGYLKELGECLSDVPFVAYNNMDMQNLDVEIGFPVPSPLPGKEDIKPSVIPAGRFVFCMYRGPYTEIEDTYNEMAQWIRSNVFESAVKAYEYYYNGPEYPESEFLTRIMMPLK